MSTDSAGLCREFFSILASAGEVELVVETDLFKERADVRRARVLEYGPDRLVTSQTEPPLPTKAVGRTIQVVVVAGAGEEGAFRPLGYEAVVRDIRADWPMADGAQGAALVLDPPGASVSPCSLRMHYRMGLKPDLGLAVRVAGLPEGLRLLDVSSGGCLLASPSAGGLETGQTVKAVLAIGDDEIKVRCLVKRVAEPEAGSVLVGLQFLNLTMNEAAYLERSLSRLLSDKRHEDA